MVDVPFPWDYRTIGRDDLPFGPGVEHSRLHAGLLVGDVAVIALLLAAGMVRHDENPLAMAEHAVLVVGPFLLAWIVAAGLAGSYTRRARASVGAAVANATGIWLLAALAGSALRATPVLPGQSPPAFVAVVAGTGVVALAVWRGLVTAVVGPAGR